MGTQERGVRNEEGITDIFRNSDFMGYNRKTIRLRRAKTLCNSLFFGLGRFSFSLDAFLSSRDVHCVSLWCGSGCGGVARCRLVPGDYFWLGWRGQDLGAVGDYFLILRKFRFFSVWVGSDHVWMLFRGALRCVVPACSVGMVAVVCGAVTWTAGNGFSENAKNANSGCFVFAFFR